MKKVLSISGVLLAIISSTVIAGECRVCKDTDLRNCTNFWSDGQEKDLSKTNYYQNISSIKLDRNMSLEFKQKDGKKGIIYRDDNGYHATYANLGNVEHWLTDANNFARNDAFRKLTCKDFSGWAAKLSVDRNGRGPQIFVQTGAWVNLDEYSLSSSHTLKDRISSVELRQNATLWYDNSLGQGSDWDGSITRQGGSYSGSPDLGNATNPESWLSDANIKRNDNFDRVWLGQ